MKAIFDQNIKMRKQHKNSLEKLRLEKILKEFAKQHRYDFSTIEPMTLVNTISKNQEKYTITKGDTILSTDNEGLEIYDLESEIEKIVKAAFITGTFIENSAKENASFEIIRRNATDEEHRIMLLYKAENTEFYFIINVLGIVVTIEPQEKGDEEFSDILLNKLKFHSDLLTKILNDELLKF